MADSKQKAVHQLANLFHERSAALGEHRVLEEMEKIVDQLIDAAVDEVKAQLKLSMVASGGVLGAFMSGAGYWIIDRFCNPKKNEDDEPNPL